MASRVNTRFVVVLSVAVVAVCGAVVGVGVMKLRKGPEELAALGDKAAAAGNWKDAAEFYSRAVNKDQNNPELLRLWIGALEQITPTSTQQYVDMYFQMYLPALRALAEAERTNIDLHRRYLDEHMTRLSRFGGSLGGWEEMLRIAEEALTPFGGSAESAPQVARYRALARLGIYGLGTDLPEEDFQGAVSDLELALGADPADARAATALSQLYRMKASRLRLLREEAAANECIAKARAALEAFLAANPGSLEALLEQLRLESAESMRRASGVPFEELAAAHAELLERVAEAARTLEPGKVDDAVAAFAAQVVQPLKQYGRDMAVEILDRAMGPEADNALLLMTKAEVELRAGAREEGIRLLQRVIDLPDRKLSLMGLALLDQRTQAAARQIDYVLAGWSESLGASERAAVIERARAYRDALADRIGRDRPELVLIDAKLKYASGDLDGARALLSRYNEAKGNTDPAALALLGELLQRQGSLGAARTQLTEATRLRPQDVRALMSLASVEIALEAYDKAAACLERVLQLEPGNKTAAEQLQIVRELQKGERATDPIVRTMREVQRLMTGLNPDAAAAEAALRSAIEENGQDPRLVSTLARLLASMGDRGGALAAAEAGAAANPGNRDLAELARRLAVEDPVESALASIESSDAPPLRKHLMRYELLSRAGRADEAKAEMDAARALDADAPQVLEHDFAAAAAAKDRDKAARLAERAAAVNADNVNGLSFRARVAYLDGKYEDAAAFLRQATELDPLNPLLWRFLGDTRAVLRQYDGAREAFAKALEIRPSDLPAVKGLLRALHATGRTADALTAARNASDLPMAAADPEFVELWVTLEANAPGGSDRKALEVRRELASRSPENRRNRAALAELLMASGELEEARGLIDALRAEADDLSLVELDARWQIVTGNFQGAMDVFSRHIESLPEGERSDTPHIVLARLLARSGQAEAAAQVLEQSRPFQDPKVRAVDREIADLLFRQGRFDRALEALRALVDAGVEDDGGRLVMGMGECLNRMGRHEEAETALARLGERADRDSAVLVMRAQAAAGRGDRSRAAGLLDRAIKQDRGNPAVFFARAELRAQDPAQLQDAIADMREVVRLEPRYPGARQWLAQALANTGQWEQALDELRAAVSESPDDDEARMQLINVLIARQRGAEAGTVLEEALTRSPDSLRWLVASAGIYAQIGTPERALRHLARAWELNKTAETAVAYALALTAARPPQVAEAARVLAAPELGTDQSVALLLTRARVRAAGGQAEAARADLEAAYRLVDQSNREQVLLFFNGATGLAGDASGAVRMLDALARVKPFTGWFLLNYAMLRQGTPEGISGLAEVLEPLAAPGGEDANLSMMAMMVLGQVYREQGRFEEAAATFKRLLDIVPEDPNTNNNYAYVLGHDLGRAEEALPYAEKAARLAPQHSGTLHTLGAVALGAGRLEQADSALGRALSAAVTPQEKAPVYLSLARLRLAQKNRPEAERSLGHARGLLDADPALKRMYGAELDEIRGLLEAR